MLTLTTAQGQYLRLSFGRRILFYPSHKCSLHAMRREHIRSCPLWRGKAPATIVPLWLRTKQAWDVWDECCMRPVVFLLCTQSQRISLRSRRLVFNVGQSHDSEMGCGRFFQTSDKVNICLRLFILIFPWNHFLNQYFRYSVLLFCWTDGHLYWHVAVISCQYPCVWQYSCSNIQELPETCARIQVITRSLNWLEVLALGNRSGVLEK